MEKFSAYRDAGTGIQPFLTPVPPDSPPFLLQALQPLIYAISILRILMMVIVLAMHLVFQMTTIVLYPVPPLYRFYSWIHTALVCRMLLILAGYGWIPVEMTTKKGGRVKAKETWSPRAGDVIVSNWASWAEILLLAAWYNPIFVLPVAPTPKPNDESGTLSTGRRTGTGSAAVNMNKGGTMQRMPLTGFHKVSFLKMLSSLGRTPSTNGLPLEGAQSFEAIRAGADRPVVVFPECTTSNGRGLLRFAEVFDQSTPVPVKAYQVFIMCTRYDPPTHWNPSATCSIPSRLPLPQPLTQTISVPREPSRLTIRLLPPSESPSAPTFMTSDIFVGGGVRDTLTEACCVLISQIGKLKRTGQGWEEKTSFLSFFISKQ